ncbi:MAG: hypothetical protein RLZZ571_1143 [Actinomycetota bacterium]|jgi:uncharacterized membrane protein YqgA involved in biofilm formation
MFPGIGTVINIVTILVGTTVGVFLAHRLKENVRNVVTDGLGLITLVNGFISVFDLTNPEFKGSLPQGASLLVPLGALLLGGITGSLLRIEDRLNNFGDNLRMRFAKGESSNRFTEGFVSASLLFGVGPLAMMGSINDGLGNGIDQLLLKSTLDMFAAMAFAASFGWGVAASIIPVGLLQGAFTFLGMMLGSFISPLQIITINIVGGLLLIGIGINLLRIRHVPVGDMLPALIFGPLIVALIS